jgi:hypothetical protein
MNKVVVEDATDFVSREVFDRFTERDRVKWSWMELGL